eukprot:3058328-Lingulodinium_polyedra.AAC.1
MVTFDTKVIIGSLSYAILSATMPQFRGRGVQARAQTIVSARARCHQFFFSNGAPCVSPLFETWHRR